MPPMVNGVRERLPNNPKPLSGWLRDDLGHRSVKEACDRGACGACTVLIDEVPRLSCVTLTHRLSGSEVMTLEGLRDGELGTLIGEFVELAGLQCGFCTAGMLVLLSHYQGEPDGRRIREHLSGNICRCTGYQQIVEAVISRLTGAGGSE